MAIWNLPDEKNDNPSYVDLACDLLGADRGTAVYLPGLAQVMYDPPPESPFEGRTNPGELTDEDDQRLCVIVCERTKGMTAEHWARLGEEQRTPWLQAALDTSKLTTTQDQSNSSAHEQTNAQAVIAERVAIAKGDADIIRIASTDTWSTDTKMQEILKINREAIEWKSPKWAQLFGVDPSWIRMQATWKLLQDRRKRSD